MLEKMTPLRLGRVTPSLRKVKRALHAPVIWSEEGKMWLYAQKVKNHRRNRELEPTGRYNGQRVWAMRVLRDSVYLLSQATPEHPCFGRLPYMDMSAPSTKDFEALEKCHQVSR